MPDEPLHYRVVKGPVTWHGQEVPVGELLTVDRLGAHVDRWLRLGRIRFEPTPKTGLCQGCGCTHTRPCASGCAWVNRQHTVCSNCIGIVARKKAKVITGPICTHCGWPKRKGKRDAHHADRR